MNNHRSTYIIAEAGVNHNGNFKIAVQLIEEAKNTKVDAIKFQTFITESCVSKKAEMAAYQKNKFYPSAAKTQFELIKPLELTFQQFKELYDICNHTGIQFLSTPFDFDSINFLASLNLPLWKIPSGEITNLPFLKKIGSFGNDILLSTGMADLGEIEDAIDILTEAGTPRNRLTILHCNTEYPTPMHDVNLKAMQTIGYAFPGLKIGYSDHSEGIEIPIAAVALGATVIEKHFTLDRKLPGPDHSSSLEPVEMSKMVTAIRNIELAMGTGIKKPSSSEIKNLNIARKSIVANTDIKKGEIFTETNIAVKRPGYGLSPMHWERILGKKATKDYNKDELISP